MRIQRLRISQYGGIEELDEKIPQHGVIVQGANSTGKTTFIRALRAALVARDIKPDAIRLGATRSEIFVDLGDISVRRVITQKGSDVEVLTAAGDVKKKPATFLADLLGTAPLDPIELYQADPKERRKIVLRALPIALTRAHLDAWLPKPAIISLGDLAPLFAMHGLEACESIRTAFYTERTKLNAEIKSAKGAHDAKAKELADALAALPETVLTVEAAAQAATVWRTSLADLRARARRVDDQDRRFATTRKKIADLLERAQREREEAPKMPPADFLDASHKAVDVATAHVLELEAQLVDARAAATAAKRDLDELKADADQHRKADATAKECEKQAKDLEQTLLDASETAPTPEEISAAELGLEEAGKASELAMLKSEVVKLEAHVDASHQAIVAKEKTADELTQIVDRLTHDAPAQLVAESKGIPGLGVSGDTITLNGVSMDALSGREQLSLATQIAMRLNAKVKILVVDALERLDPGQFKHFVSEVLEAGFQLIGTRVLDGEREVVAVVPDEQEQAAQ